MRGGKEKERRKENELGREEYEWGRGRRGGRRGGRRRRRRI